MAFKLPSLKFFTAADAKSRIFMIVGTVVVVSIVGYFLYQYIAPGISAVGTTQVARPPTELESVPGGQLTAEYYQALQQRNIQAAQQAQITGESAVPTLVKVPGQDIAAPSTDRCLVVCPSDATADVTNDINNLVREGKLSQNDANTLLDLAKKNVTVDEYANTLDDLVKQGKLTPEQARQLLAEYKKQHQNVTLQESGKTMDALIKNGQLSLDAANQLLALQKNGATPAEYATELNRLVQEGKISPEVAQQLLSQYTQQRANEATQKSIYGLQQMAKSGAITQEVANQLADLQKKNIPVDQYAAKLQQLVNQGKLTPEAAAKLLEDFKSKRQATGAVGALNNLVSEAQRKAASQFADLVANGKISKDVADALQNLQNKNVSPVEYQKALDELVKAGKISPQDAQKILANYQELSAKKQLAQRLLNLQGNNATIADYKNELKQAVESGYLTPEEATALAQEYQTMTMPATFPGAPGVQATIPGAEDFAALQRRVQEQQAGITATPTAAPAGTQDFTDTELQARQAAEDARQQRIQQLQAAMSNQAQSLVAAWQPSKMQHVAGSASENGKDKDQNQSGVIGSNGSKGQKDKADGIESSGIPLIKTGTIYFAILETAVNSDYPDTPVMATIVEGPFKGAKLLGKMVIVKDKDKMSLSFNLMDKPEWPRTKTINAFAIDPDTARTVMATSVDYHYLLRYGGLFASSFLSGYASAITNAGTSTTGIFGTSTSHPELSPQSKIAVGLGQVGTAFSNVVQSYVNTPPTIKITAGVGIGILFMADVV